MKAAVNVLHYTVSSIAFIALALGCSKAPSTSQRPVASIIGQATFEVDQQRRLVLTHDAESTTQFLSADYLGSAVSPHDPASGHRHDQQWRVCQTELPILHIDTAGNEIADEPKVAAKLKIIEPNAAPKVFSIAIEWRGRTSQTFAKKSYGFELRDEKNHSVNVKRSLLEMRDDDDWILDALWNEPLAIRDFTAQQIWRTMAADHVDRAHYDLPQQKYCELFLDGEYRGIYYLGERVDRKLLNISKQEGQLVKAIAWADGSSFRSCGQFESNHRLPSGFESVYPKSPTPADVSALCQLVISAANADSVDLNGEVETHFQSDNIIDYFIFTNLLAAMDNRAKNYYLARQNHASAWFFVPWDLDLTVGMCFPKKRKNVIEARMYNELFRKLMRQPEFVQAVTDRWCYLRNNLLNEANLKALYRHNYERLANNGVYDRQQRYPELRFDFESPDCEIKFIDQWITSRIEFLDGWLGNTTRLVRRLENLRAHPAVKSSR